MIIKVESRMLHLQNTITNDSQQVPKPEEKLETEPHCISLLGLP